MKNDDKVIITRTPLRVSFIGGGTDMPYFYNKYSGATLSCAINKYIYVTVKFHNNYQEKYRLNYSQTENTDDLKKIKNLRIKSVIQKLKINNPLYINTFADLPANSGLGSSSSFTVGLIKALSKLINLNLSTNQIAEMAYDIEAEITNNSLGKQDHYICAYGGLNFIKYLKNEISISPINLNLINHKLFFSNLLLIWTGKNRSASEVLQDQKKNKKENFSKLKKINALSENFKETILRKNLDIKKLGSIIDKSWILKKKLSVQITNDEIDQIYKMTKKKGAYGGKLLGAGNGGFILILASQKNKLSIKKKLKKYKFINFSLDKSGSIIL